MDRKHERCSKIFSMILPFFFLFALIFGLSAEVGKNSPVYRYDKTIREKGIELDSIKSRLHKGREQIKSLKKKERTYLGHLELLEKNIDISRTYLYKVNESIDTLGFHIDIVKDSLVIVSKSLVRRQIKMRERLRSIYKTGRIRIIEIILTSVNITDMLNRIKYFQELNRYDNMLLNSIDSIKSVVLCQKQTLETEQEELLSLKSDKESEKRQLEKESRKRKSMLTEVRKEKDAYLTMVKELEQAQKELNLLISRLEKKRKKAKIEYKLTFKKDFKKRKGKLSWPVNGSVVREFGKIVHPVYKTVTINNGIDIKAQKGKIISCVAPGVVDYIGWMRGYGKFVIINHFENYLTIYAHLDRIDVSEGESVQYGTGLGLVGETGSLNGPKLHFQIRHSTDALNPSVWLEKKE